MAIKIPENTLPVRDLENGDYIRVVGADGKSYRVPSESVGGGGDAGTVTYDPEGEYDEGTVGSALQNAEEDITDAKADLTDLEQNKADIIVSSASGSIAHFEDGAAYDAVEVVAHIEPVQDLHGYDSPWPAGGGKNKFDSSLMADASTGAMFITLNLKPNTAYTMSSDDPCKDNGTITDLFFCNMDESVSSGTNGVKLNKSITRTSDANGQLRIGYRCYEGWITPEQLIAYHSQVEEGSTATSYAPYSNICPISGWTGCDIVVSPTEDAEDGTTYPITFPSEAGTVYGGYVDVTQGKLVVTDANIASYSGETLPSTWISDRDVYAEGTTPTTGAQVVYKLDTPIEYDLTPTQIDILLGTNNVWNTANGDTDVTYRADTKLYIEQLTKPTEDDMTANTTIQSGKFFMIGNRLFVSTSTIASGDTINPGTNCTELSLADALNSL